MSGVLVSLRYTQGIVHDVGRTHIFQDGHIAPATRLETSLITGAEAVYLFCAKPSISLAFAERPIPSGKHTKSYGKSPFLMGKLTISMAFFRSKLLVYQAGYPTSGLPPIHPPAADITNGLVQPELDGKSPVFSEGKIPRVFLKRIQKVAWGTGGKSPSHGGDVQHFTNILCFRGPK